MSLVGPRPERPYFVEQFSRETRGYGHRHRVPMGLTGWAQVNDLRGDTSIDERALALVRYCQSQDHQVFVVPRFYEMMGLDRPSRIEVVRDVAVVRLRRWRVRPHALLVKRCFDATLSAAALAALAPLMLGIALAVRLETGPPCTLR